MRRLQPARARRGLGLAFALLALAATASTTVVLRTPEGAGAASTAGYWLVGIDGGIFNFGQAGFYGSTGAIPLNQPIVGMAPSPTGHGYWMVASDGGIFAFGDAPFFGSMGGKPLNKPIVGMAPTRSGRGYWLVAADGGIFAFGDAAFFGSMGGAHLNKPIVDIAATPSGRGYWLTATDGGIFNFGDAGFYGSAGAINLVKRIQAMAATPSGRGYWMVGGDGGIFAFGDAGFYGAAIGDAEKRPLDMAPSASGLGYYVTTSNGQVLPFGDAKGYGGADKIHLNNRIAAMAAMNGGEPPVGVDDAVSIDEDVPITIDVLANDRAPGGGTLSLRSAGVPQHGTASVAGRSIAYKPAPDYNGSDVLTYTLMDESGATATARANITIRPVNDKPVAVADTITMLEDTPIPFPVLANDTGIGDGIKPITIGPGPGHGTVTVNADNSLTYTPNKHYSGDDAFSYKIEDMDHETSAAKVAVKVTWVNHTPTAVSDTTAARTGKSVKLTPQITDNDDSPDGITALKLVDAGGNPTDAGQVDTAAKGIAKRDKQDITYTAPKNFTGSDTFSYVIVDKDGQVSAPASVTVNVGVNGPPVARDGTTDPVTEGEKVGGSIAGLASDPEHDDLTFTVVAWPANGQLDVKPNGDFTYQAPTGGARTEQFRYKVNDGNADSNEATVTIQISAAPPPQPQSTTTSTASLLPLAAAPALARRRRVMPRR
jgi:hypothetical protein